MSASSSSASAGVDARSTPSGVDNGDSSDDESLVNTDNDAPPMEPISVPGVPVVAIASDPSVPAAVVAKYGMAGQIAIKIARESEFSKGGKISSVTPRRNETYDAIVAALVANNIANVDRPGQPWAAQPDVSRMCKALKILHQKHLHRKRAVAKTSDDVSSKRVAVVTTPAAAAAADPVFASAARAADPVVPVRAADPVLASAARPAEPVVAHTPNADPGVASPLYDRLVVRHAASVRARPPIGHITMTHVFQSEQFGLLMTMGKAKIAVRESVMFEKLSGLITNLIGGDSRAVYSPGPADKLTEDGPNCDVVNIMFPTGLAPFAPEPNRHLVVFDQHMPTVRMSSIRYLLASMVHIVVDIVDKMPRAEYIVNTARALGNVPYMVVCVTSPPMDEINNILFDTVWPKNFTSLVVIGVSTFAHPESVNKPWDTMENDIRCTLASMMVLIQQHTTLKKRIGYCNFFDAEQKK